MRINVAMNTASLDLTLENVRRNLAYSTAEALNDTAFDIRKEGQKRIRALLKQVRLKKGKHGESEFEQAGGEALTKDEGAYLRKRFRVISRANIGRGKIYAVVGWRDPAGFRIADFETAQKLAGDQVLYLSQVGKKYMTLEQLALEYVKVTPRTTAPMVQLKGKQRTFGLFQTKTFPKGALFQRTGPGRNDLRTLISYAIVQRERIIQRLLDLPAIAQRIYNDRFKLYFDRRFAGLTKGGKVKANRTAA